MLFSIMVPVVMFDILESSWTTELIWNFDNDGQEALEYRIKEQMLNLGYDNHNSILILGSVFVFMGIYFAEVICFSIIYVYSRITKKCKKNIKQI